MMIREAHCCYNCGNAELAGKDKATCPRNASREAREVHSVYQCCDAFTSKEAAGMTRYEYTKRQANSSRIRAWTDRWWFTRLYWYLVHKRLVWSIERMPLYKALETVAKQPQF
jgi:hypothetical protein